MSSPTSDRKSAANRENSKKSTGPKTTVGKAISRFNALKHGIFAEKTVIVGPPLAEDPLAFIAILAGLRVHYDPVGVHEDVLVQEIAVAKWKEMRLERYEAAGARERLHKAATTARTRLKEERWGEIQTGIMPDSALDTRERPMVTAKELQEQIDLVEGLERGDLKDEDQPDFWSFGCMEKLGNGTEPLPPESVPEAWRDLLKEISPTELEELKGRFRSQARLILEGMWMLRAKVVPHEAALERSLVPDEDEVNKIIRYSTYLTRLEERKVKMLEHLQEARRKKEGGSR